MFELSVALKYLVPRWRQLSVSIISMISILVIALVVWLILVFFSVTNGLEKSWINKLISLTAPVRITPTDAYYKSFYYLSDTLSAKADYTLKTIGEKRALGLSYDPEYDEEAPADWPKPDLDADGNIKDIVTLAFEKINAVKDIPGIRAGDYIMTVGNLHLKQKGGKTLSQTTYLGSLDAKNQEMAGSILSVSPEDLTHLYSQFVLGESRNGDQFYVTPTLIKERLDRFYHLVQVKALKTPESGWAIPRHLFPKNGTLKVQPLNLGYLIPKDPSKAQEQISLGDLSSPLYLEGGLLLPAEMQKEQLYSHPDDVLFKVKFTLQNQTFEGVAPYRGLNFGEASVQSSFGSQPEKIPFWGYTLKFPDGSQEYNLPKDAQSGEPVLLPKTFRSAHVNLGDRGFLSYYSPTTSTVQQMYIPIFVAGFYDPGIIPIGAKFILTNNEIASLFRTSHNQDDMQLSNGINVRLHSLDLAEKTKERLLKEFEEAGIAPYFKIETYREFEFTKDLIQQLHSEKNLFTLIATVIIIVACSNIISMLIILVNDKKLEIGILRSMGASSFSIALIFGFCGVVMGLLGSLIGTLGAFLTLRHLQRLIEWISWIQGYDMFNPVFYGEVMPSEMSGEAFSFVFIATVLISLLAGIVPAVKASLLRPSATLRAE